MRRRWPDVAGVGSIVLAALAYLAPSLKDGFSLGTFDFVIPLTSLGSGAYSGPPHNRVNSDVVSQMNAWLAYDWRQIHAGSFPLWNDLTLSGVPHFFNFEAATLSLPSLVAYAVPLHAAFLVAVLVKLLLAGTGAYVFARVAGLGVPGSAVAGLTWMLSGGFVAWVTWPIADVLCWAGWIAAFALLAFGGRRWAVAGLAVAVGFSIYGGFPEANVFLAAVFAVGGLAAIVVVLLRRLPVDWWGLGRVAGGTAAGVLLAAPLWLPGLQLLHLAHRGTETTFPGVPARALALMVAPGYDGLPIHGGTIPFHGWNYYETVSYVGVVVLALAAVAVACRWRSPLVWGCLAMAVVCILVSYQTPWFHPFQSLVGGSSLGSVEWLRTRTVIGLPLGVLGGMGFEALLAPSRSRRPLRVFLCSIFVLGGVLAYLFVSAGSGLPSPSSLGVREQSLWWPLGLLLGCLACAGLLMASGGRHRQGGSGLRWVVGAALIVGSGAFLFFSGVGLASYSSRYYPVTPALAELQHLVGRGVVALDTGRSRVQVFAPVGIYPEANLGYGIAEYAGHDPLLPQAYFVTFDPADAHGGPGFFEPSVSSLTEAQQVGAEWVLVRPGLPAPPGLHLVATLAGERLYSVPHAKRFSFVAGSPSDTVTSVSHPGSGEYDLAVATPRQARLLLRVTKLPGWHASVDGRPVALSSFGGTMMSVEVPAGAHSVRLWYLPSRFVLGLFLALAGAVGLASYWLWSLLVRRRAP